MVKGRGYFRFWIECYHYTSQGKNRRKVITHTNEIVFYPQVSVDVSGHINSIKDITKYVFISYLPKYFFDTDLSQMVLSRAYLEFINANTRDQFQNYSCDFKI